MEKTEFSIPLKNRLEDLSKIEAVLESVAEKVCCSPRKLCETNLIIEELFTNIVNHGFDDQKEHTIHLSISWDQKFLTIRIEDDGKPFNPTELTAPDTTCCISKRLIGGLGIHLMKHFVDICQYSRKHGKNIVVLQKRLSGPDKQRNICFFNETNADETKLDP